MKRSTSVIVCAVALLLGSGVSGLLFTMPAFQEQDKLLKDKSKAETERHSLEGQVAELEGQLKGMAMDTIAYFDLRKSTNKPKEMESKTVETLSSLTEIFNDHHIRVSKLDPKGESTGLNKPIPAPSGSPGPSPAPATGGLTGAKPQAAAGTPAAAASESPIHLTHKQFQFVVRGEYADLVKAMGEIQGLPRAISVNQYNLALVQKEAKPAAPSADGLIVPTVSPTLLELEFQLSITFLMDGGPQLQAALPTTHAGLPGWLAYWLGEPAEAAEAIATEAATPAAPAKAEAAPKAAPTLVLDGVSFENGELVVTTRGGSPRFTLVGGRRDRLILALENTRVHGRAAIYAVGQAGIVQVRAAQYTAHPLVTRLVIDTDGSVRLHPTVGADGRLHVSHTPMPGAKHVAKRPEAKAPAKPVAKPAPKAVKVAEAPAPAPTKAPTPAPTPTPIATPDPLSMGPRLSRSLATSYRFPIEREKVTGRANPFKVLPNRNHPPEVTLPLQQAVPAGQGPAALPAVPAVPGAAVAAAPSRPAAHAAGFVLKAVLIWGGEPPVAVVAYGGKTYQVGLNGPLPGNARVKVIKPDYVVITANGMDLKLSLAK